MSGPSVKVPAEWLDSDAVEDMGASVEALSVEGLRPIMLGMAVGPAAGCDECGWSWRYEVVVDDGCLLIREWHKPGCWIFEIDVDASPDLAREAG